MSKFGSLLVQDQILGVTQIEQALQHQVIYGGDLVTNLLELELVDEAVLTHYGARALGVTAIPPEILESPGGSALRRVPWETVQAHRIMPVRLTSNQLFIAVSGPIEDEALEEIAAAARVDEVVPQYVLEFRLAMMLNRFYGFPIVLREQLLQRRLVPEFEPNLSPILTPDMIQQEPAPRSPEAVAPEAVPSEAPEETEVAQIENAVLVDSGKPEEKKDESTIRIFTNNQGQKQNISENSPRVIPWPPPERARDDSSEIPPNSVPPERTSGLSLLSRPPQPEREPVFDFDEAKRRLDEAGGRDDILGLIVEYGALVFDFVVLFVVHGSSAQGRDGRNGEMTLPDVAEIVIPLDRGGMFGTVFETNSYHLGPLALNEVTEEAFRAMGRDWPQNCALLPVTLRHRVILLIYGDRGRVAIQSEAMSEYVRFMGLVGGAFERILLRQKYGAEPDTPSERENDHLEPLKDKVDSMPPAQASFPTEVEERPTAPPHALEEASSRDTPDVDIPSPVEMGAARKGEGLVQPASMFVERDGVRAATVVNISSSDGGRSVVVNMDEEIDRLVERVLTPSPYDETAAKLLLGIGVDALAKLIAKFPGPLLVDRYESSGRLLRVGEHGPLLKTILKFGKHAVSFLLPLFHSMDTDVRFYVTFLFSELHYPEALEKLTTRLFDNDRHVRAIAMDVLKGFKRHPEYLWAIQEVVRILQDSKTTPDAKRIAAEALGGLKESSAVVVLAESLDSEDSVLAGKARRSLVKIAFCDLGLSRAQWLEWWQNNRGRHRVEWAIEALTHPNESFRKAASWDLKTTIGSVVDWPSELSDQKQCADLRRRLGEWWEQEGRELYPRKEN